MSGSYANALAYNPQMRTGRYRPNPPSRNSLAGMLDVPPTATFAPPVSRPTAPTLSGGTGALSGVPEERRPVFPTGGGDVGTGVGGPGPAGAPSTGSVFGDISAFGSAVGPALGAFGTPMGVAGLGLGAIASGAAAAFGMPGLSESIANAVGLPGPAVAGDAFGVNDEMGGIGDAKGDPQDGVTSFGDVPAAQGFGQDMGFGSTDGGKGDAAGTGENGEDGTPGGEAKHEGGMIRPGDGRKTGAQYRGRPEVQLRALEGEFVMQPEAVARYGVGFMQALNAGQVPPNALAAMMGGGRRMTAANHLLQAIRR